eukprot:2019503-Pleurochrysis_carterae.AAC.2
MPRRTRLPVRRTPILLQLATSHLSKAASRMSRRETVEGISAAMESALPSTGLKWCVLHWHGWASSLKSHSSLACASTREHAQDLDTMIASLRLLNARKASHSAPHVCPHKEVETDVKRAR